MANFDQLYKKLQQPTPRSEYVSDGYDEKAMNEDVSAYSSQLSPEDLEKIHYAETTGGKFLKNNESTASGNYQLIDSTREMAEKLLKKQDLPINEINPLKKDAMLMKALVGKYENVLENAKSGPYEANLDNIYLMHKNGIQGGLNSLKSPNDALSKARFEEVKRLMARKPKSAPKEPTGANNLLELLKE